MLSRTVVTLLLSLVVARALGASVEWPQRRGPDGNGIAVCGEWNPAALSPTPRIAWRAQVGSGYAAMAVADGRVYATGGQKGTNTVYCLDAITGREVWRHAYASPKGHPRATPAVAGGRVYVVSTEGYVLCLDAHTGAEQWQVDMAREYGAVGPVYGHSASPRVAGDLLLLNAGRAGLALDTKTGAKVWASGPGRGGYSTPVVHKTADSTFAAVFAEAGVYAVRLEDGTVLWSYPWRKPNLVTAPDPVLFDDRLFLTTGSSDGSCALLDVAAKEPRVMWQNRVLAAHFSSGVRFDNYLYAVHGDAPKRGVPWPASFLKCIDLSDGTEKWAHEIGFGSVIAIDCKLIVLRDGGEAFIAEADPAAFKELARGEVLSGECWTEPAFSRGRLYCRNTPGEVVCADLTATQRLARTDPNNPAGDDDWRNDSDPDGFRGIEAAGRPDVCTGPTPPRKPYRLWYQPPYVAGDPDLYQFMNWENSGLSSALGHILEPRGITMGKWSFGTQSPYSGGDPGWYKAQCYYDPAGPFAAAGIDEWTGASDPSEYAVCAEGIRRAKTEWPWLYISVYTPGAETNLVSILNDGSCDLAIIEGYTYAPGFGGIGRLGMLGRGNTFKSLGLADKTIMMVGHVMDGIGADHLRLVTGLSHDMWPEFPGIGFYGRGPTSNPPGDKAMIALADSLSNFYWGDDVLFADGFESYSFTEGQWQTSGSVIIREGFNWTENDGGQPWTGGDFDSSGTGVQATSSLSAPGAVSLDVADIVTSWITGGQANRGLVVQLGGPISGSPGGTSRSAYFHSVESAETANRPELELQFARYPTMTKNPVDDGYMTQRQEFGRRAFDHEALLTHFTAWWDYSAIYLRFDLDDVTAAQVADMTSATLTLEATDVTNPDSVDLRAARIHPDNTNTEATIEGADNEKVATLRNGGSIRRDVSTSGRASVKLEYSYRIFETAAGDGLLVEWYDGSNWQVASNIAGGTVGFVRGEDNLPEDAGDNPKFAIRFTAASGADTKVYLDIVRVTGVVDGTACRVPCPGGQMAAPPVLMPARLEDWPCVC